MAELIHGTPVGPSISVSWLVISHGSFLGAAIGASGLTVAFVTVLYANILSHGKWLQRVALGWGITSFFISLWTLYAISRTYETSLLFPESQRIFKEFGFFSLAFVAILIGLSNVYTLYITWIWKQTSRSKK